ncbi:MAG: hypothetical protein GX601_13710, partial [Anaerolineales bacterium]|nr:hypothetical protein [Anaerolineales bacterium]
DDAMHLPADAEYESFVPCNKIIYLTPHTFLHHQLIRQLIGLNYREDMGYVVLDEVHCISNWSHDFYPEYLMLSYNLRQFVDKTGYRCFTATADYTVVRDIQAQLGIRSEDVISPIPLAQGSRKFSFIGCDSEKEMRAVAASRVSALSSQPGRRRALVFTKTADVSRALRDEVARHDERLAVDLYNAADALSYVHFAEGRSRVLIADADLGVGINLREVASTLHLGLPISKSQYVQEMGRAGRGDGRSQSTVVFLRRDAYPVSLRPVLRRTTPIEDLVALCATRGASSDPLDALSGAIGNIEPPAQFYRGILGIYHAIEQNLTQRGQVTFPADANEPFGQQTRRTMRYLYVLYRIGYLIAWYIVRTDGASRSMTFYVDAETDGRFRRSLAEINHLTATYLRDMGAQEATISAVRGSHSVEETIRYFVDWYYHQFLYHHREQLVEMQDFLETYEQRDDGVALQALGDYFSLSLLDVQHDVARATSLTIKDITLAFRSGLDAGMVESIARENERSYSAKLDYLLFGHALFALHRPDVSRLERVISALSEVEFDELLEHISVVYRECEERDRLRILNALCQRVNLKRVVDALYSRVDVDLVYCGILAWCANSRMGA